MWHTNCSICELEDNDFCVMISQYKIRSHMSISTKKGDTGLTSLLSGERVSKDHLAIETVGTLDEANSLLGLARASSKEKRVKRIILQVQKHLFIIGAELSVAKGRGRPPKKTICEADVKWLEKLIEDFEDQLALPPGFVTFGQEEDASQMDVARTSVRKVERMVVKMKSEDMVENPYILRYLNRLSDLIFVLACFEEKSDAERRKIARALFPFKRSDPVFRRWTIFSGLTILVLVAAIILLLLFHKPASEANIIAEHMKQMELMDQAAGK
jgi:cob(I)alamin adenosyltransferase